MEGEGGVHDAGFKSGFCFRSYATRVSSMASVATTLQNAEKRENNPLFESGYFTVARLNPFRSAAHDSLLRRWLLVRDGVRGLWYKLRNVEIKLHPTARMYCFCNYSLHPSLGFFSIFWLSYLVRCQ